MNIDLEKKDKINQYLFIDKTENEKLTQLGSNLTNVYLVNNLTKVTSKVDLKQLYSKSKNELKQIISRFT